MADSLVSLLANAADTKANFDFGSLAKSYWAGLDEAYKRRTQDAFQEGVPKDASGNVDWDKVSSTLLQKGGTPAAGSAVETGKLLQQLLMQRSGESDAAIGFPGGVPKAPLPPSTANPVLRSEPVPGPQSDNMTVDPNTVANANAPLVPRPVQTSSFPQQQQPLPPQALALQQSQPPPAAAPAGAFPPPPGTPQVPGSPATLVPPPQTAQQAINERFGPPAGSGTLPPQALPLQPPPPPVPLPPPPPPVRPAPPAPPQQQAAPPAPMSGISPAAETALRAAGLVPPNMTVADQVQRLGYLAAKASRSGIRGAAQPFLDPLNAITKIIEQYNSPNDMIKNYTMNQRQGDKRTFDEYQNDQQAQAARMTIDTEAAKSINDQVYKLKTNEPLLRQALELGKTSYSGYMATLSPYMGKVLSSFGIDPGKAATDTDALRSLTQLLVPLVRQPGATSNYEAGLYLDAVGNTSLPKESRLKIANLIFKMIDRSSTIAQIYRDNIGKPDLYTKLQALDGKSIFTPDERALLEDAGMKGQADEAKKLQGNQMPTPEQAAAIRKRADEIRARMGIK